MGLICFDLDGTLVDSSRAVEYCVQTTCREFALPVPDREQFAERIGARAVDLFTGLPGMDQPLRLDQILERYWTHLAEEGVVKYRIYDGVLLLLARLKRQGHQLYAISVQPARYARQVLHQFDLLLVFDDVFGGPAQAPWLAKGEVVAQLGTQGILHPGGYLVGDRAEDLSIAQANGLIPLGVTYGFARPGELQATGVRDLFDSVADLDVWFQQHLPDPEIHDPFSRSE